MAEPTNYLTHSRGHTWLTTRQTRGETYGNDEIDECAYSEGIHNGPRCGTCDFSFCLHCQERSDWFGGAPISVCDRPPLEYEI